MLGSALRAPTCAPVIGPRCAHALVVVAHRALGRACPPVLYPTHIAKALLCLRGLG
jgi:hypothetical protein